MTSRRSVLGIGMATLLGTFGRSSLRANENESSARVLNKNIEPHPIDEPANASRPDLSENTWDPIGSFAEGWRMLESITLIPAATVEMGAGQDPKDFPGTRFPLFHQVRYEESAPQLMRYLSFVLPSFPLCYALPEDVRGGWGGSGMRLALLRMKTNRDTFWISITRIGFARGAHGADFSSIFFSVPLALTLDLMYQKATGESLPSQFKEALTGMTHLRKGQESFERWQTSQK